MAHILATKSDGKLQHGPIEPIGPVLAHGSDTTIASASLNNPLTVHELRRMSQRKIEVL